ncbi:hypothetical protein H0248_04250 [Pectobacterium brasiliense]|uniref:hypothetical protein n=1 Tax=Pectobacterium brasiliense TaxID=180957 RepID=UPI0015DF7DA7|nr:hypothetical protein [Pectobacterium brasiliense]MBA0216582.1 hypothetical protein [Pectobacterium brasiliense]
MQSTAKNQAYQRGLKAAGIWKGTKNRLKQCDAVCVAWATQNHLPKLVGHIPVTAFLTLSIAAILFGGFIIGGMFLLLWAVFLISPKKGLTDRNAHDDEYFDDYWWWWRKK